MSFNAFRAFRPACRHLLPVHLHLRGCWQRLHGRHLHADPARRSNAPDGVWPIAYTFDGGTPGFGAHPENGELRPGQGVALVSTPSWDNHPSLHFTRMMVLGSFANSVSVAQIGDVYRGYLLKHEAAVSLPTTLGTILAERMVDLVTLVGGWGWS